MPTLTGANVGELGGLMGPGSPGDASSRSPKRAQQQYGAMADEFLKLYPATTDEQAAAAQAQSSRDQALVSMYLWARERAGTAKTPAYTYLWDHTLPGPDAERFGAFHTSEVPVRPEHAVHVRPSLHRRGSEDRRHDVVLLGELRRDGRPERKGPAPVGRRSATSRR